MTDQRAEFKGFIECYRQRAAVASPVKRYGEKVFGSPVEGEH